MLDTHDDPARFFLERLDRWQAAILIATSTFRACATANERYFLSIWIDGRIMGPPAVQKALDQIDAVHENVRKFSKDMVFCPTAAEVRSAHAQGKIRR